MNLSGPRSHWKETIIEWIVQCLGECIADGVGYLLGFLLEAVVKIAGCIVYLLIHCVAGF